MQLKNTSRRRQLLAFLLTLFSSPICPPLSLALLSPSLNTLITSCTTTTIILIVSP